jgi:F-type H+-transporting ATPase subunit alpha
MKKTAGSLRLDLAQFRELAAFSQFASDLDMSTRKQLDRGKRLMEVIKQGIHVPMPVVKQVSIIFAGANGYLDDIPANKVREFEVALSDSLDKKNQDFVQLFNKKLELSDDVKAALEKIIQEVKQSFA